MSEVLEYEVEAAQAVEIDHLNRKQFDDEIDNPDLWNSA